MAIIIIKKLINNHARLFCLLSVLMMFVHPVSGFTNINVDYREANLIVYNIRVKMRRPDEG